MAINNIPFVPPPYRSTKGTSDQPPDHGTLRLRFEGTVWTGISFATLDHAGKKKRTKRDVFLAQMAAAVPWSVLEAVIAPHYPKEGPQGGRRPFPIAVMLRIYCLQQDTICLIRRRGSTVRCPVDPRVLQSRTRTRSDLGRDDDLERPGSARSA
jgi:hypothetical protein